MRSGSALLLVLLLGSLQLSSSAPAVHTGDCCIKLTKAKIPLRMVESYTETPSNCLVKAVVLITRTGKQFCVDPYAEWVISHITELDQRSQ